MMAEKEYALIKGPYRQKSVKRRIEAFLLDNVGKVATREQIIEVARDPETGRAPENWHQRLSELRTDEGYTILSWRNSGDLKVSEYLLASAEKRPKAAGRVKIGSKAWQIVLERAGYACEWMDGEAGCGLRQGDRDPVGGGTVRLTPDHKTPHAVNATIDPDNPDEWQALCGRHQVMKKNYWDDTTGWLNVYAIVQAASEEEKRAVYEFLTEYFSDR
ncbi:MAG: restriction endonuclease [Candidatus Methylomirabilales bacterium]